MSYSEKWQLGNDPGWRSRCQMAAMEAATNVSSEDDATPGHTERAAFANKVLLQPALMSPAIAFGVAAQPGITGADASDSDILFTCNALWDAWSGVV